MSFEFGASQIVFKLGKYYRISNSWTPDGGNTTVETELREWNYDADLRQLPTELVIGGTTSSVMGPVVFNGSLNDGSTHSLLDLYEARDAYFNLPDWTEYAQRKPVL